MVLVDFKNDPYSEGNSCNTICCRGDLRDADPKPSGCYDTKVSDYKMALNFEADIINGPTRGTGLPPFSWTSEFNQTHMGLPTTYNFDFLRTSPKFKTPWKGQQAAKRNFKHSAWIYQINSAMMILIKHVLLILLRKSIVFSVAFNHWCMFWNQYSAC